MCGHLSLYNKIITFYGSLSQIDWCKLFNQMLDRWKNNDIFK
jgi:hypothetical protein